MTSNDQHVDLDSLSNDDVVAAAIAEHTDTEDSTTSIDGEQVDLDTDETETETLDVEDESDESEADDELTDEQSQWFLRYSKLSPEERAEKIKNGLAQKGVKNRDDQYQKALWLAQQFDDETEAETESVATDTDSTGFDEERMEQLIEEKANKILEKALADRGITDSLDQRQLEAETKQLKSEVQDWVTDFGMDIEPSKMLKDSKFLKLISKSDSIGDAVRQYKKSHYKAQKKTTASKISSVSTAKTTPAPKKTGYREPKDVVAEAMKLHA